MLHNRTKSKRKSNSIHIQQTLNGKRTMACAETKAGAGAEGRGREVKWGIEKQTHTQRLK